jgi:diketogulonate reductase-like aldo/keto reductase
MEKVKQLVVKSCSIFVLSIMIYWHFFGKQTVAQRLNITPSQLAIAWCLKNEHVSSVITGASRPAQVEENVKAIQYLRLLTTDVMHELDLVSWTSSFFCAVAHTYFCLG